jgi:hypothetical protein
LYFKLTKNKTIIARTNKIMGKNLFFMFELLYYIYII